MVAKGDDIQDRLVTFAVQIIRVSSELPRSAAGKHIAGSLIRTIINKKKRLNMDSGQLRQEKLQERSEQAFTANPSVMHELKETEIQRQLFLGDAPMGSQPGTQ